MITKVIVNQKQSGQRVRAFFFGTAALHAQNNKNKNAHLCGKLNHYQQLNGYEYNDFYLLKGDLLALKSPQISF